MLFWHISKISIFETKAKTMHSVGKNIKQLREQKGYTQEQVADYLNISQSTYARIEKGERNSWVNYLDKLCEVFDVQADDLVKQEGIIVNNNQKGGNGAFIINQLSEKLIEQYELRLQEKEAYILKLEALIEKLQGQ